MDMKFSEKAEQLDAGIFAVLNEKKNELVKQGRTDYKSSVPALRVRFSSH